MKTRFNVLGILLLLVCSLLWVSCNNDDDDIQPIRLQYAIYGGKPSPVTNNQIIINLPTEEKTELVIFGGNGEYSISNSDDTKLSVSRNYGNGSLELTALTPGNVVVIINDSHNNSYTLKVQIRDQFRVKMNVKEKEGNIFDLMEFNLFSYSEKDFTLLDLTETYDSIVWTCSSTNQRFRILENSENTTHFTWKWSNCFFLPAEYKTCLLGYKNSRVISRDTISINIANNKDFLGYNWKDVVCSSIGSTGYQNVFIKGYDFATNSFVAEGVPSVCLFLIDNKNADEHAFAQRSKQILFDYISSLYSTPTYSQDDVSLSKKYNDLFSNKKDGAVPECIWITPKSKIVLLKEYDDFEDFPGYKIYAEPVR
jgi:hypothetical protein